MRRWRLMLYSVCVLWPLILLTEGVAAPERAMLLQINGAIGPATSDHIHRGLERARDRDAHLVILQMDTPGGLDTAMRRIIQDIIASPVPVVTFVAPSGARAASAGTYILLASPVAAMAPATTVGAATPVRMGTPMPGGPAPGEPDTGKNDKAKPGPMKPAKPGMDEKALNDAISYIRGLAQLHGRNVAWAEKAVREADSISSEEALKLKVADLIAADVADLMKKLDGRKVRIGDKTVTLATRDLTLESYEPDWRSRLLSVITDPNIAYILLLLGIYGLFFEMWNPGFLVPGIIGGISLLLALYAFQLLPINYAGLGLILLGIVLMVAEAFAPSFGALGIGGVVAFVVGSVILMDTDIEGYTVAWPLIAAVALTSAIFFILVVSLMLKARRRRVVSGAEELPGATGEALEGFTGDGRVRVHSEEWQARSRTAIRQGQRIRVTGRDGLVLHVEPVNPEDN